jgi:hypothetical protein
MIYTSDKKKTELQKTLRHVSLLNNTYLTFHFHIKVAVKYSIKTTYFWYMLFILLSNYHYALTFPNWTHINRNVIIHNRLIDVRQTLSQSPCFRLECHYCICWPFPRMECVATAPRSWDSEPRVLPRGRGISTRVDHLPSGQKFTNDHPQYFVKKILENFMFSHFYSIYDFHSRIWVCHNGN